MRPLARLAVVVGAALLAAGCGSGAGTGEGEGAGPTTTAPVATTARAGTVGTDAEGPARPAAAPTGLYADPAVWLCHPERDDDACDGDLDATVVAADGSLTVERHERAAEPAVDCFYVYPTVSGDTTVNSDLDPGDEEANAARNQVARFDGTCRVFAPVYRQVTLAGLFGAGSREAWDAAYADVLDAWNEYLTRWNDGRGVVVVGHSQGSGHLNRLLREEVDPYPAERARLVSALLLGSTVRVPPGADVGGDFTAIPACRATDQTGCVVSYASYRASAPPPPNAFFGRPRGATRGEGANDGTVALCTNPAALAGGEATLRPYFPTGPWVLRDPAAAAAISTPFVTLPDLVRGECVERDGFSYLSISVDADPADPRADDVPGDLSPEWGLHVVDANLAMGDLVALVAAQAQTYTAG
jgi:hypothetical protein